MELLLGLPLKFGLNGKNMKIVRFGWKNGCGEMEMEQHRARMECFGSYPHCLISVCLVKENSDCSSE